VKGTLGGRWMTREGKKKRKKAVSSFAGARGRERKKRRTLPTSRANSDVARLIVPEGEKKKKKRLAAENQRKREKKKKEWKVVGTPKRKGGKALHRSSKGKGKSHFRDGTSLSEKKRGRGQPILAEEGEGVAPDKSRLEQRGGKKKGKGKLAVAKKREKGIVDSVDTLGGRHSPPKGKKKKKKKMLSPGKEKKRRKGERAWATGNI